MSKKERREQEQPASWLATFGDMATLLLTFYVMIYASCTYRPGQWETAQGAIKRMLAVLPGMSGEALVRSTGEGALSAQDAVIALLSGIENTHAPHWGLIREALEETFAMASDEKYESNVEIEVSEGGLVFRLSEPIAFGRGSADLHPDIHPFLRSVAKIARSSETEVIVEGHTCDLPIQTERFASNWELSGARAGEVVRFLEAEGIGTASISARACSEYQPRVPNEDEDSRRRNRRVDIQVTFKELIDE
jgi:chemotaxis protein MotB